MNTTATSCNPTDPSSLDEAELVRRWREDDDSTAVETLLAAHLPALRRHLTHRFGEQIAEEAISEVLLKIARGIRYQHRGHFRAWLQTVGRRAAIDVLRRNQRIRRLAEQAVAEGGPDFQTHGGDRRFREAERSKRIAGYIAELPTLHRAAVQMRYWKGYTTADIARTLQISTGQVRDRLAYAFRAMRKRMPTMTLR